VSQQVARPGVDDLLGAVPGPRGHLGGPDLAHGVEHAVQQHVVGALRMRAVNSVSTSVARLGCSFLHTEPDPGSLLRLHPSGLRT